MKNLAIVVHDLSASSDFSVEKMLFWLGPLKAERFGIIPIFEAKTVEQLALVMNLHEVYNVIISNSYLVEKLTDCDTDAVAYQIRSETYAGTERNFLLLPNNEDVEWRLLEPALDRFEELL